MHKNNNKIKINLIEKYNKFPTMQFKLKSFRFQLSLFFNVEIFIISFHLCYCIEKKREKQT